MGLRLYLAARWGLRVMFPCFGGMEVRGVEKVPMEGPLIVASNHASFFDPMLLGTALPRPLAFMARKTLFEIPLFGSLIRELFAFPLDREGDSREALRVFGERLAQGWAVVLFPEGTRTRTGRLGPMKSGVGMLAVRNHAPVLPVYIWGSYQSWPRHRILPRFHPFKILISDPIFPATGLSGMDKKVEQQRITEALATTLHRLERAAWQEASLHSPPPSDFLLEGESSAQN